MRVTTKDNHIYIIADTGNYVGLKDESIFGEALSLGVNTTTDNVIEMPISEWPVPDDMDIIEDL